jgi:hypothetical protein
MLAGSWFAHPQFGVLPSLPVNRQHHFTLSTSAMMSTIRALTSC